MMQRELDDSGTAPPDHFLRGTGFFQASYTPALRATLAWSQVPSLAVIPVTTPAPGDNNSSTRSITTTVRGRNVASSYEEMVLLSEDLDVDKVRQSWLRGQSALGLPQQAAAHLMFSCNIQ